MATYTANQLLELTDHINATHCIGERLHNSIEHIRANVFQTKQLIYQYDETNPDCIVLCYKLLDYQESLNHIQIALEKTFLNDKPATPTGENEMCHVWRHVAQLFSLLLQMRRNHDWLVHVTAEYADGPYQGYIAALEEHIGLSLEHLLEMYDDLNPSPGNLFKTDIKDVQDELPSILALFPELPVEPNFGQVLDFDM